jgi:hypothetical protein
VFQLSLTLLLVRVQLFNFRCCCGSMKALTITRWIFILETCWKFIVHWWTRSDSHSINVISEIFNEICLKNSEYLTHPGEMKSLLYGFWKLSSSPFLNDFRSRPLADYKKLVSISDKQVYFKNITNIVEFLYTLGINKSIDLLVIINNLCLRIWSITQSMNLVKIIWRST